jgi:hypothetical protein
LPHFRLKITGGFSPHTYRDDYLPHWRQIRETLIEISKKNPESGIEAAPGGLPSKV